MKKLFPLLFTLCAFVANAQLMFYHSTAGGQGTETTLPLEELTEIPFHQVLWNGDTSIHNVARVDSLYQGVIGVGSNYYVEWDIIEALPNTEQGDTLASGTGNYITYVFGPEHTNKSYDISIRAWWDFNAGKPRYIRRAIRNVGIPILTGSEPGVTHMNISTASGFWTSPPATDTVLLYGHRTSGNFIIQNWPGVYIQVEAGTELNASFVIGDGCTGVTIDACTDNSVQYGFLIHRGLGTGDAFVVDPDRLATYTTTDSITVSGIEARESTVGFHLEGADVAGNGSPPASPKLSGYRIFNCLAYETDTEGFYLGWTRDYEGFAQMVGAVYHHLVAYYTGWDGMQPGNTDGCEVQDLQVWFAGQQDNSNQFSDFSINGIANGWFYNLNMQGGHKGFTGSTGQYGGNIHIFRTYIEGGTHNESLQYSWYRLGDGAFDDRTVDFLMYNSFFHNNYNGPFGFYVNGANGADSLNFQFDDNVVTGTHGYSAPSSSYLIDLSYTKSWLADYDTLGYGADLTSGGFPDGPPGGGGVDQPTTQAHTITFSSVTTSSLQVNWTRGDGDYVIAVMHEGAAVDSNPVDAATYTASSTWESGTQIGTGNYVIYKGTGTNVTVIGLDDGTEYHVRLYEFNGEAGEENYLTSTASNNPNSETTDELFYALYNFGGSGADPAVSGTISIWDTSKSTSNETYTDVGPDGVDIIAVNGSGGGPPTLSSGQYWGFKSGNTNKAFAMTVTGTNLYHNSVLNQSHFLDNAPSGIRIEDLPDGTYTIKIVTLLTGDATTRTGRWSVNGGSTIDVQCNTSGTSNVLTSESSHMAIFEDVETDAGVIYILGQVVTGQYVHMNAIEVIQTN